MINYHAPSPQAYFHIHGAANLYHVGRAERPLLSLKAMVHGPATYETDDGGRFVVDDNSYLILNHQQPYTMIKDAAIPVESFCIFFGEALALDIARAASLPDDALLDEPMHTGAPPLYFFEQTYPHDRLVSPYLHSVRSCVKQGMNDMPLLEEKMHGLLIAMIQTQRNLFQEIEQLPAARHATRVELYKRLHRARDYIHAGLAEPHSLAAVAQAVHLSPHHLLRSFKALFGMTPHTYLTQKRIERAQYLLAHTARPITEICMDVGYESLSSFSNLFRRETGVSPRAYRQQVGRSS